MNSLLKMQALDGFDSGQGVFFVPTLWYGARRGEAIRSGLRGGRIARARGRALDAADRARPHPGSGTLSGSPDAAPRDSDQVAVRASETHGRARAGRANLVLRLSSTRPVRPD